MPNIFTPKGLSDGELPDSESAIFTASEITYLKQCTLFNKNALKQIIILKLDYTGTARFWKRFELEQNEHASAVDGAESVILEPGDIIIAETTTPNAVDFTLAGVEET